MKNVEDIKLGKMYMFTSIDISVYQFQNPNLDWYAEKTLTLREKTPFIPLQVIKVENCFDGILMRKMIHPFRRIKVLLGDGTICYLAEDVVWLRCLKEL